MNIQESISVSSASHAAAAQQAEPQLAFGNANGDRAAYDKFSSMMSIPAAAPVNVGKVAAGVATTPVGEVVIRQTAYFQQMVDSAHRAAQVGPSLGMVQMTAASMDVMLKMSMAQMHFSAGTAVANSSEGAVQALLKNQ